MEFMNIDTIIHDKEVLDRQLRIAASTMARSDQLKEIYGKIQLNQSKCPHFSTKYNWVQVDSHCPYCGKNLAE